MKMKALIGILIIGLVSLAFLIQSSLAQKLEEESFQLLLSYLHSNDPGLQKEAIMAFGDTREKRAVPYLIPLLKNKNAEIRILVCETLRLIQDPRAEKVLIETLKDPDPKVREASRDALGVIVRHKRH